MHPLVRDLYKRFLHVGHDYPKGYAFVREKARAAILGNAHLKDEEEIIRAVHKGRWWVNELIGVVKLRKYRAMKQRYGAGASLELEEARIERALKEELQSQRPKSGAAAPSLPPPPPPSQLQHAADSTGQQLR